VKGDKTKSKGQKTSNGGHSTREKGKLNHNHQSSVSNNNLEDDLGETDSDDTISSTTDSGTVSESDSGKASPPSSFPDHIVHGHHHTNNSTPELSNAKIQHQNEQPQKIISSSSNSIIDTNDMTTTSLYTSSSDKILKDGGNLADTSGNEMKWN
jgi:hypothetical protein